MELPTALRQAVDRALGRANANNLASTAAILSQRYRDERRNSGYYVSSEDEALAYLATRLPATYAAIRAVFSAIVDARADFSPAAMLDVGAGPGTALWAATDCWPDIAEATLVEANPVFLRIGQELAAGAALPGTEWQRMDIARSQIDGPRGLVTAAYVLNEIAPEHRLAVVEQLWRLTSVMLVIVEPGTPSGWQHILAARERLIVAGGHIVAPCPHTRPCPLAPPDWCHFSQRLSRSAVHRRAKGADIGWEDEKFSYLAVSRNSLATSASRIVARPRKAGGHVTLKLCRPDGTAGNTVVSRREGDRYKQARRSEWGASF
jgi:ribosomal protein RSM22 (predicted rRNA methylase)